MTSLHSTDGLSTAEPCLRRYHPSLWRMRAKKARGGPAVCIQFSSQPTAGGAARYTFRNGLAPHDPGVVCGLMPAVLRWQRPTERCREMLYTSCEGPSGRRSIIIFSLRSSGKRRIHNARALRPLIFAAKRALILHGEHTWTLAQYLSRCARAPT